MFPFGETVTVIRHAARDRVGDRIAPSTSHSIKGCAIAPGQRSSSRSSRTDYEGDRDTVIAWRYLYCPAGSDIRVGDEVTLSSGRTYLIEGDPDLWRSPFTGWMPGIVVQLRAVF